MFWRMAGLSTASPVETVLDKDNYTLEELLDEDEIIQECKSLNGRLINFLRERTQVEQLIRYIVEEAPEDAEKTRTFKFPFIACEIFTCEVDIILKALVEDEELMNLLFSFVEPDRPHTALLAGYFSKVVVCLLLRKTIPLMLYIRAHQDIMKKMVDLVGITSIMEVLIRLIGADEHLYSNYTDSMQWLEETDVLEMIVDKFNSSDCPEVHTNAAETLCAITRYAPPGLTSKISSPSFIGRLFRHALEESRPKSVLVNSLSVSISLLDPKRLTSGSYYIYNRQMTNSGITPNPDTVKGMLENLADLLKLLDVSCEDRVLPTTYGKLQPPLGKHRLKIVEFISVLVSVSSEAAEKELIKLGAVKRILELFFEYPYNNFVHHHIERIIESCLDSKNPEFVEHLLRDCNLLGRILEAEKSSTLTSDTKKPTAPAEGKSLPRIGNSGHIARIANKIAQLGNTNTDIQAFLQENSEWVDWHTNVLLQRNALENVFNWACGRPTTLHDRARDSDDDDYQDRDYDVAALANNLSQAFRYGIYTNDDIEEAQGSLERDDEDVYFDDESAEVVISSLRLGDDQESGSLFTNSNWFAFEDSSRTAVNPTSDASPSDAVPANTDGSDVINEKIIVDEDDDLADTGTSEPPAEQKPSSDDDHSPEKLEDEDAKETGAPEWVEWRESSTDGVTNGEELQVEPPTESKTDDIPSSTDAAADDNKTDDSKNSTSIESAEEVDIKETSAEATGDIKNITSADAEAEAEAPEEKEDAPAAASVTSQPTEEDEIGADTKTTPVKAEDVSLPTTHTPPVTTTETSADEHKDKE